MFSGSAFQIRGPQTEKLGHHTFLCGIEERRDEQMTHEGPGRIPGGAGWVVK